MEWFGLGGGGISWLIRGMSFAGEIERLKLDELVGLSMSAPASAVSESLGRSGLTLADFAQLDFAGGGELLEALCRQSQALTQQRFGKVIRLFAPLYLSNECINNCKYCGFSRDNPDFARDADAWRRWCARRGRCGSRAFATFCWWRASIRNLSRTVTWRIACAALHAEVPGISLEVGPMETEDYRPMVAGGRGRVGRLPGNLRPRGLRGNAHGRAEAEF